MNNTDCNPNIKATPEQIDKIWAALIRQLEDQNGCKYEVTFIYKDKDKGGEPA